MELGQRNVIVTNEEEGRGKVIQHEGRNGREGKGKERQSRQET